MRSAAQRSDELGPTISPVFPVRRSEEDKNIANTQSGTGSQKKKTAPGSLANRFQSSIVRRKIWNEMKLGTFRKIQKISVSFHPFHWSFCFVLFFSFKKTKNLEIKQ